MSAPVTWATAGATQTIISLVIGLTGVWLSRTVFVNRENRRLERPATWRETLPITLSACLIAGVLIVDRHLGISASAFVGLGTGWTTVLILELFGDRILNAMRVLAGGDPMPPSVPKGPVGEERMSNLPEDMERLLREIDHAASPLQPRQGSKEPQ